MWPWEHLAIGYLIYSLVARSFRDSGPTGKEAIVLAVGTQFPDLIDKPIGWGTTLLPSGQSLAHSALVAVPVVLVTVVVADRFDRRSLAVAFGIGYLSHLPGDVLYAAMLGGPFNVDFLLWPVIPASATQHAMLDYVRELFFEFAAALATPQGVAYLLFEGILVAGTLAVWILDGSPGLPWGRIGASVDHE